MSAGALGTGDYYALLPVGEPPAVYPVDYDDRYINFPGVDWTAVKRFGKRSRIITATLIIAGPPATVESRTIALENIFTQLARYTIEMPNSAQFNGCRLATKGISGITTFNMDKKLCKVLPCTFVQLSDTN